MLISAIRGQWVGKEKAAALGRGSDGRVQRNDVGHKTRPTSEAEADAGGHGDVAANNTLLLQRLGGVPPTQRHAHFYCVLVLLRRADDPQPLIAEACWHGYVLEAARGEGGFGYDPLFFDPAQGLSAAEMDADLKNRISHRGKALAMLRERLHARPL